MTPKALWTDNEVQKATGGESSAPWQAGGVSIDSRTLQPGDLFIALKGPNFDGHDFLAQAFSAGAAAALVDHLPAGVSPTRPLVRVNDTMEGLTRLAAEARRRTKAKICAITGSVGKTSTREALQRVLSAQGETAGTRGNLNNQWGLPLSLARMSRESCFGVFEIGMNHAGEITPLSRLARPDVALITNVEAVHMAFFNALEEIAAAKAEIFQGLHGGTAILLRESPFFDQLSKAAGQCGAQKIVSFGAHAEADIRLVDCLLKGDSSSITAVLNGRLIRYRLSAPGRHWVINSLGVLAAAAELGADVDRAAHALSEIAAMPGRGQQQRLSLPDGKGSFMLIDESYNASPASVRAAIAVLSRVEPGPGGRRILVLGDMLELGAQSAQMHAALAADLVQSNIDMVFTCGHDMKHLSDALPESRRADHLETAAALAPWVKRVLRNGDVVTVKGSQGSRMRDVVNALAATPGGIARAVNGN